MRFLILAVSLLIAGCATKHERVRADVGALPSAADSTNRTVVIAGKERTLAQVEAMIREHAKKTKIPFDFKGAKRHVDMFSNSHGVLMSFMHPGEAWYLMGSIDKNGTTSVQANFNCGGIRRSGK